MKVPRPAMSMHRDDDSTDITNWGENSASVDSFRASPGHYLGKGDSEVQVEFPQADDPRGKSVTLMSSLR